MGFASVVFPKNLNDKKRIAIRKFVAGQIRHSRDVTRHFATGQRKVDMTARIDAIYYTLNWIEDETEKSSIDIPKAESWKRWKYINRS